MSLTILVTGFGPFPGAPFNPTGLLAQRATRARRPALADVKIITHIFPTSYAAVDRELPSLIAKHKPDALLMFGLAPRASTLRVETRARNTLALLPDAGGASLGRWTIAIGKPASIKLRTPDRALLAALRGLRLAPHSHVTRDATSATICAGALPKRHQSAPDPGSPPSFMYRRCAAARDENATRHWRASTT
jgi:pyroglutamyl-peptidase